MELRVLKAESEQDLCKLVTERIGSAELKDIIYKAPFFYAFIMVTKEAVLSEAPPLRKVLALKTKVKEI